MSTFKLAAAVGIAAILASTSFVQAGGPIFPQTIRTLPHGGPGDQGGPGNNKPAPEFGIDDDVVIDSPVLKLSPFTMSCSYSGNHFEFGDPVIRLKNIGTETIPAGSIITVTWPDGTTKSVKVPFDVPPGASVDISGPPGSDQPGFRCGAHVKVKILGPANPMIGH